MSLLRSELSRLKREGEAKVKALTSGDDTIKCLIKGCNFETKGNLMVHVSRKHGINRTQYLIMNRLPYSTRLYGAQFGQTMREDSNIMAYHRKRRGEK